MEFVQTYDISIEYLPGKVHPVDALSRRPDYQALPLSSMKISLESLFKEAYAKDDNFKPGQPSPEYEFQSPYWVNRRTARRVVPLDDQLRATLLAEFHDSPINAHPGVARMYAAISRIYTWPGLKADVKAYVASCQRCQRVKPTNQVPAGPLQPLPIPTEKWQELSMDLIGPLPTTAQGFTAICVVVDRLTKMTRIFPTFQTVTAPQLARQFIDNVVRHHGIPSTIVTDRGSQFISHFWTTLFEALGTQLRRSTAYHPQSDGQTERANRTLITAIRAYVNPLHNNWDQFLTMLEFAYNNSKNTATGETPFFLNYGFYPKTPVTLDVSAAAPAANALSNLNVASRQ